MKYVRAFFLVSVIYTVTVSGVEPNPPTWPSSVTVFDPSDTAGFINGIVNAAYTTNGGQSPCNNGQFSPLRFAFLFKPGTYPTGVSVPVGYYTSVIGLGQAPSDTNIPDVYCEQGCADQARGALDTFWRSAENFATTPTRFNGVMQWAVSQACPLRRIQIPGTAPLGSLYGIQLWQNQGGNDGFASGGFIADCHIASSPTTLYHVDSGPQQQWFSRNCQMDWSGGVWNMVFVGCVGNIPPTNTISGYIPFGQSANTNVAITPVIAEKPYIRYAGGLYFLEIPNIEFGKVGPTTNFTNTTSINFTNVYVVTNPANETAANINAKISAGLHILLTPGIYGNLGEPIVVNKPICILGIGFPTLIASNGQPCIIVRDGIGGVRIGGILMQAGSTPANPSPTLLQWGQTSSLDVEASFLYDCFARVGGPANPSVNPVSSTAMVVINQNNVICDNAWLWRADHWSTVNGVDNLVVGGQNPCNNGLIVNGDNVIAYGLAVEHTLQDLVQWNGENGRVFFFQAEYPYDVTQDYANKGYVAYRTSAQTHNAFGLGVYCFFRDFTVNVPSGIATPIPYASGIHFTNVLTKYLTGKGGITHVINTTGLPVNAGGGDPSLKASCIPIYPISSTFYPRKVRRSAP